MDSKGFTFISARGFAIVKPRCLADLGDEMQEIGAFEAKNKFAELLRRVEAGEVFCVTRHGKVVAQISAPQPLLATTRTQKAFSELRKLRKNLQLTPEEVAALRSEGRS